MLTKWCCFDIRDGTLFIALLTMILRILCFIAAFLCADFSEEISEILNYSSSNIAAVSYWMMGYSSVYLLVSCLLAHGVLKLKRLYLLPWIIWTVLDILGNSALVILICIGFPKTAFPELVGILGLLIFYAFQVYCILCVVSLNENFKSEIESQLALRHNRVPSISESITCLLNEDEEQFITYEGRTPHLRLASPIELIRSSNRQTY